MPTYQKCISAQQQKILLHLMNNEKVDFHDQEFYKCRRTFNKSMNHLVRCGWLKSKPTRINNHYANEYIITLEGLLVTKTFLVIFNES